MEKVFLGIDGGATKTVLVLTNLQGEKLFETKRRGSNYRISGIKALEDNLYSLIQKAKKHTKNKFSFAVFGLAGINMECDREKINHLIRNGKINKVLDSPFLLVNDVEIVLPSIGVENGMAVIAGTGSHFFAQNKGKIARASGLDFILSDEGSSFDIGAKVLKAAVRFFDGRGKNTLLGNMVLNKTKIKDIRNLSDIIYKKNFKAIVAQFAPLADQALEKKDKVAKEILFSSAKEILSGILAVAKKVNLKANFKIALSGGTFESKFLLIQLKKLIRQKIPGAEIILVKEPALGAAKLALREYQIYHGKVTS